MRSGVFCIILVICFILVSLYGCETFKGAMRCGTEGFSKDCENVKAKVEKAVEGSKKLYRGMLKADEWFRENLW